MNRRLLALVLVLDMLLAGFPIAAAAQGTEVQPWTMRPASGGLLWRLDVQGGQTVADSVLILNPTDRDLTLTLEAVASQPSLRGGFDLAAGGYTGPDDCVPWVRLDESQVTLAAGTFTNVGVTFDIPADAAVGTHECGLVAYEAAAPVAEGMGILLVTRIGLPIILTVPGPRTCDLRVLAIEQGWSGRYWSLTFYARNDGNGPFEGTGRLTARKTGGASPPALDVPLTVGRVHGFGSTLVYPIDAPAPTPGDYEVSITLTDSTDPTCAAAWSGAFSIQGQDFAEGKRNASEVSRSAAIAWLVEHGSLLLVLGGIGLAVGLALTALLVILRSKGGGAYR